MPSFLKLHRLLVIRFQEKGEEFPDVLLFFLGDVKQDLFDIVASANAAICS